MKTGKDWDYQVDLEDQILTITTTSCDRILQECPDALLLYIFFYRTAKRQSTLSIRATSRYCRKGLRWGETKFNRADKVLRDLGLIEKVARRGFNGQVQGWYVRIKYVTLKEQTPHNPRNPTTWEIPVSGEQRTNTKREEIKTKRSLSRLADESATESDSPSKKKMHPRYFKFAHLLKETIETVHKVNCTSKVSGWAKQFKLLHTSDGVSPLRIRTILKWYCKEYPRRDQYLPIADSGASFRGKFTKIEEAKRRRKPQDNYEQDKKRIKMNIIQQGESQLCEEE